MAEATPFQSSGDFLRYDPGGGVTLYLLPTGKFKTTLIRLFLHRELNEDATRIALLSRLLMRGFRRYPTSRKISRRLDVLYGMSLGADVVKIGERHILALGAAVTADRCLPAGGGLLAKAFDLLHRALVLPVMERGRLRREYVDEEKENLRRTIMGLINDKAAYAHHRALQAMFPEERYRFSEYGRLEEIDAITPESLTTFFHDLVASSPIDLYVSGDVDPGRVARAAGKFFRRKGGAVAVEPAPLVPTLLGTANGGPREVVETCPVDQSRLVMGWRTGTTLPDVDAPDMVFFNALLGGFSHSRLFTVVREREGLAYHADSFVDMSKGALFVSAGIDGANRRRAAEVIREQIAAIASGDFTEEEMGKTRISLVERILSREDHPSERIVAMLPMTIHGKIRTLAETVDVFRRVTPEGVAGAARKIVPDVVYCLLPEGETRSGG